MLVHLDTIAISTTITTNTSTLLSNGWRYVKNPNKPIASYYYLNLEDLSGTNKIYLKYFHNLDRLSIQFNIRKLMTNSSNNSEPIFINSKSEIYNKLDAVINPFTSSYFPQLNYAQFLVSRADIAHNHIIPTAHLNAFFELIQAIRLPRYHKHVFGSTLYLNSSATKYGASGVVVKIYDKTDEMLSKNFSSTKAFYEVVDVTQEELLDIVDDGYLIAYAVDSKQFHKARIECAFKSRKLNAFMKQRNLSNTFENILEEHLQLELMNGYINNMHLNVPFQSKLTVYSHIDRLYKNPKLNKLMKQVSYTISNKRCNQLSKILKYRDNAKWLNKQMRILYDNGNGCHLHYTNCFDLDPVKIPTTPTVSSSISTP